MSEVHFLTYGLFPVPQSGRGTPHPIPELDGALTLERDGDVLYYDFDNAESMRARRQAAFVGRFLLAFEADFSTDPVTLLRYEGGLSGGNNVLELPMPGRSDEAWWVQRSPFCTVEPAGRAPGFHLHLHPLSTIDNLSNFLAENRVMTRRFRWDMNDNERELFRVRFLPESWSAERVPTSADAVGRIQSEACIEDFVEYGDDPGARRQNLQIREIRVRHETTGDEPAVEVCLLPNLRRLDLAPQVLRRDRAAEMDNPIAYGLTAANGELVVGAVREGWDGTERLALEWRPRESLPSLLLLNNLLDEHGLPVALEILPAMPLRERADFTQHSDRAAAALTLGGLDLRDDLPVTHSLLRGLKVETDPARVSGEVTVWREEGDRIVLRSQAPRELHGLARNSYLVAEEEPGSAIGAALSVRTLGHDPAASDPPAEHSLVLTALQPNQRWRLRTIFEEEDYAPGTLPGLAAAATPAVTPVGHRESRMPVAQPRLPAMDLRFALANMDDAVSAHEGYDWHRRLDTALLENLGSFASSGEQQHVARFRLADQQEVGLETLLGRPRTRAEAFIATDLEPLAAKVGENKFLFGRREAPGPSGAMPPEASPALRAAPPPVRAAPADPALLLRRVRWRLLLLRYYWERFPIGDPDFDPGRDLRKSVDLLRRELDDLRLEALESLEGKVEMGRELLQVTWALARITLEDIRRLDLETLADWSRFEQAWKSVDPGPVLEAGLERVASVVQVTVDRWRGIAGNLELRVGRLDRPRPIHQRLCLALARLKTRLAGLAAADAENLRAVVEEHLLEALRGEGENVAQALQAAWLNKVDDAKRLVAALGGPERFQALKRALLWSLPPTQELVPLFAKRMQRMGDGWLDTAEKKTAYIAVRDFFGELEGLLDDFREPSFDVLVRQGRELALQKLREEWEKNEAEVIQKLREVIPIPHWNDEVYERLLGEAKGVRDQVAALVGLEEAAGDLLQALKTEPPAYLVFGKAFHIELTADQQAALEALTAQWGRSFQLCDLGAGQAWDFQLDGATTVILKLSNQLTLEEILLEIQNKYRADTGEPDPLGLWTPELERDDGIGGPTRRDPEHSAAWTRKLVRTWVERFVDPDLRAPSWRGVFFVRPLADLERNQLTRDLCGLRYLRARYVALGGDALELSDGRGSTLDVYATIFAQRDMEPRDAEANTDAGVALVRFDARIRNTRLRGNSEIVLRLDLDRLWGRDVDDPNVVSTANYREILIRGVVEEPDDPAEGTALAFAAVFKQERILPVGVACIEAFGLRAIRARLRNGRTTLEIDARVILQDFQLPGADFKLDVGELPQIELFDFRLQFPDVSEIVDKAIGAVREMLFDLASLELKFPTPRSLTLGFLELRIRSMGYLRKQGRDDAAATRRRAEAVKQLERRFLPLVGGEFQDIEGDFPYLVFDADFGRLPKLGGALGGLELTLLFGLHKRGANDFVPVVGLGGLDARELRFDLFRVLTLSIRRLFYTRDVPSTLEGYTDRRYSVLGAEDIRLALLGMNLIGDASGNPAAGRGLDFLMIQDSTGDRGLLGLMYKPLDTSFVTIDWVLLGRNVKLETKILNHLLTDGSPPEGDLMSAVVRRAKTTGHDPHGRLQPHRVESLAAALTGGEDWLFGFSFRLGELFKNCRLILHDEHYYGISLRADWLTPLLGGDKISLAYIPGSSPPQDRFLFEIPLPLLDLFGQMKAGWLTVSWAMNTDTLVGLGFPFRSGARYQWDRAFAVIFGVYEAKFGLYVEKRSRTDRGSTELTLGGGVGFSLGYGFAAGTSALYVRAGIGVFIIVEGNVTTRVGGGRLDAIYAFWLRGVIGIFAYVEGGINIWIISAHFRAELQASLTLELTYRQGSQPLLVTYEATLYAGYHASASINCGFTKITFTVSGEFPIRVAGRQLLE